MLQAFSHFSYDYSDAFTCAGDSVPYLRLLQRVAAKCPRLREVKVNMEMFAERLNGGLRGENNGANIVNANPSEIADRMRCYKQRVCGATTSSTKSGLRASINCAPSERPNARPTTRLDPHLRAR